MDAKNLTLLAIDDNQDNLTTLKAIVCEALPGCTLLTALNGSHGLKLARAEDPDVILLDIAMPGMDGFEVCRRLKADELLRSIPVVFLTVLQADLENRVKALEAGGEGFLSKTADGVELIAQVWVMAKLKEANRVVRLKKEELAASVAKRTLELEQELADRKLAEAAVRASEAKYRRLHESMTDAFVSVSMDGQILEYNDAYRKMLGYELGELAALTYADLTPSRWHQFEAGIVREQILPRGYSDTYAKEYRRKDGTIFPVELRTFLIADGDGKPAVMWAIVRDITDRKQAEEALRRASAYNRSLIEASLDPLVTIGPDGKITDVNEATETVTGRPRHELIGTDFSGYFTEPEKARAGYQQVFREGSVRDYPLELRRVDGHVTWVLYNASIYHDEAGKVIGVFAAARDITARKQVEENLRVTNTQLVQAVARSEEMAVRAETANRAKSEFLANMSHEIRTPMTAILGYSDLLTMGDLSPAQQHHVQAIQSSGRALMGIISDILDLSLIESDRLPLHKTDCSLRQIIQEVTAQAKIASDEKGLTLQVAYDLPEGATISTDATRLCQMLLSLVGNAVKFTERGEVRLTVRWCKSATGTARIQFAVSDTGIGIPSDKLDEIFRPFVQVDGSYTRRYGGTGLGLSICQRLAEALQGRLEVTSELGRGSTFTLTMDGGTWRKTQDMVASPDPAPVTRAEPEGASPPTLSGRILFVEDAPSLQQVMCHLLRNMDLEAELAGDGQIACQLAEQSRLEGRPYALILMDVQLPRMDGLAATQRLRSQNWSGPIVALTAHALVGDRERCLAAGCDDYLSKPITSSGLHEILRRYLG